MYDGTIKIIVENFPEEFFHEGIPKEDQISRYVDAIMCQYQALECESDWKKIKP